ncbi:maleylpyruvate isomerase family mycothiol-dependent enzyme [Hoyosella sp. YIM 151337]|uniref:maleylpyruvate isomerase family mycothiol-dependent enzyme n=1 Tax=Hoyosella sp. YIM 151337 TaxID=2992742 RepID=UPI002235656F|nr:maleylpyruvate isomerase family mycothiol-dependent enzyme [Hoyosella sp. YIM 151337]MCW4352167.1 maleylpyruvate isomerase family mycothiol-dependent enzyme [Hoyosella sp. YIM 151337]
METKAQSSLAERFERASGRLTAVLVATPMARWDAPSPCEGWTARDVVRHVIDTEQDFFAQHGVDLRPKPDASDPNAAWAAHSARVQSLLADEQFTAARFDGYFGPTTIGATFDTYYLFDVLVHRWDIATAAGLAATFTEEELEAIEERVAAFGDTMYMEGICKPALETSAGADRQTALLAKMGRAG